MHKSIAENTPITTALAVGVDDDQAPAGDSSSSSTMVSFVGEIDGASVTRGSVGATVGSPVGSPVGAPVGSLVGTPVESSSKTVGKSVGKLLRPIRITLSTT